MPNTRSYEQYCPMARSLDLLGERWTLLVLRELFVGPQRFVDLRRHLPGLGANLLTTRLRHLEEVGLVQRRELPPPAARTVYELTERGRALDAVLAELARFGLPLLDVPTPEQQPLPHLLPMGLRAGVRTEHLPDQGLRVHLRLDEVDALLTLLPRLDGDGRVRRPWDRVAVADLGPDAGAADVDADVVVRGSVTLVLWLRQGVLTPDQAADHGLVLEGSDPAVAAFLAVYAADDAPVPG